MGLPILVAGLAAFSAPAAAQQPDEVEIEVDDPVPAPVPVPVPVPPPVPVPASAAPNAPSPPPPVPAASRGCQAAADLGFSGYLQPQYEVHQLSEDGVDSEGDPLNQDRFVVRRGRLRAEAEWTCLRATLELDANTVHGPFLYVRTAEASAFIPGKEEGDRPYLMVSMGQGDIPFGYELPESSRHRLFMERTQGSRALFPSDADVGAKLSGGAGPLVYDMGVQNGAPLATDPSVESLDPIAKKTLLGRFGVDSGEGEHFRISGGASALYGMGFHAGNAQTKDQLLWKDANQDGLVTLNELVASQGQAAQPSIEFERWAVGGDLEIGFRTSLGWTHLQGEAILAANLDRGYYVADPISTGFDLRESAWNLAITQDVTEWAVAGLRVDRYDPNADLFEQRRGLFAPLDASVLTVSPVLGAQLKPHAKLLFQWDYIVDFLGRNTLGQPIDLPNDVWTLRSQVEF
jgi:hypothetical protein